MDIGFVNHHLEEGGAGSGLVGWRRHWVEETRGECGVEFGEARRERVMLLTRMPVGDRRGLRCGEVHDWGKPTGREPNRVSGGRIGELRVGFGFLNPGRA